MNDALLTWLFILGGIALGVYALIAFEGTTLAMVSLAGAEIFVGGLGHFYTRLNAMRYAAMGEASEDDVSLPGRKPTGCGRRGSGVTLRFNPSPAPPTVAVTAALQT